MSIASADLMSIQGQVTDSSGNPSTGDLQVLIYDNLTNGNLVYNSSSDFDDAITNGRYDVVLGSGETLSLVYGRLYYMDLLINGEDLDFSGSERQVFQSTVGEIKESNSDNSATGDNSLVRRKSVLNPS